MIANLKFRLLISLLKWYCNEELDQWDLFKMRTKFSRVFITISRTPGDVSEDQFEELV